MAQPRFSIAHVTPHPLEDRGEVNTAVWALAEGLQARGHRVLILAPSRSPERVRVSRLQLRNARQRPASLLEAPDEGGPRVLAIGEVFDVPSSISRRARALPIDVSRTIENLLSLVPLDFVHVHDPFAPSASSAALRYSRALNIGSFHTPGERLLSTLGRRFVESFFGRLDARTASSHATAELMQRHFPASYEVLAVSDDSTEGFERIYSKLAARRHDARADEDLRRRLLRRKLIDVDLHMHTDHSYDCATPVEVLLATARAQGLGAIAVTDHNEISGALEAREKAAAYGVKVIVGEEVKTAEQGEVIGLFIEQKIPRGLTMAETVAAIKRQGGLVYVPHPFDRMHAVPDYEHLLPVLDDVDAIEVFNSRVAIGTFNEEASRFAAKYRLPAGAGSDSHVAQGLGSVRIRMRDFDTPDEFLQSLRDAEILTKPSSLLYVQALKFLQTRATPSAARRVSRERRVRKATRGGRA